MEVPDIIFCNTVVDKFIFRFKHK